MKDNKDMEESLILPEKPFLNQKIPVSMNVSEFQLLCEQYPDFSYCPYLAYKDEEGWERSTSRIYMNQVLPKFLYMPVNISKDDNEELRRFFNQIREKRQIVAVNVTQPHKSNNVLMAEFADVDDKPTNIDTLLRGRDGRLVPFDLNGPSFLQWFESEVGSFTGKAVVLIGVGGVGEPIARKIAQTNPSNLVLVDPVDKSKLVDELKGVGASYKSSIEDLDDIKSGNGIVVINASGKEGVMDSTNLVDWLKRLSSPERIFVDLRPHMEIDIVKEVASLGWKSFTGHGMNARNDYTLLEEIAKTIGVTPPSFEIFKDLVAKAS